MALKIKIKIKPIDKNERRVVLLKCKSEAEYYKVKHIVENLSGTLRWGNSGSYQMECILSVNAIEYIKRKWTIDITET
jgi:hypothetical protein